MCGHFIDRLGKIRSQVNRRCRNCTFYKPSMEAENVKYCSNECASQKLIKRMEGIELCLGVN